jgi:hypothetical protein
VNPGPSRLRRAVTLLAALALVGALYFLSQPPTLSSTDAEAIAARFRFEKLSFPEPAGFPHKTVRQVHPSLANLSAYPRQSAPRPRWATSMEMGCRTTSATSIRASTR